MKTEEGLRLREGEKLNPVLSRAPVCSFVTADWMVLNSPPCRWCCADWTPVFSHMYCEKSGEPFWTCCCSSCVTLKTPDVCVTQPGSWSCLHSDPLRHYGKINFYDISTNSDGRVAMHQTCVRVMEWQLEDISPTFPLIFNKIHTHTNKMFSLSLWSHSTTVMWWISE